MGRCGSGERSYRNFVVYLAAKLSPDYVALIVEANTIEIRCSNSAAGLYALYRSLYDAVRAELGPGIPLFATLTYPELLAYDSALCYPSADFALCGTPAPNAGVDACFPMNRAAIDALDLGDRLDVLALSFYPDGLEMNPVATELAASRFFRLSDMDSGGSGLSAKSWPDLFGPLVAIDRLNWSKPFAVAETSARSCVAPPRIDLVLPGQMDPSPLVVEIAGSPAAQASWLARTLDWSEQRDFLFYAHSFLRDYQPIGPWTVDQAVLPESFQQLLNTWPCSGFQDTNGVLEPEIAALGLPEPDASVAMIACALASAFIGRRRCALALWRRAALGVRE